MLLRRLSLLLVVVAVALALPGVAGAEGTPIPGQYIVVLKDGVTGRSVAAEHTRSAGAKVIHTYDAAIHGYAARLSPSGLAKVKADPRVRSVVQDVQGNPLGGQPGGQTGQPAGQTLPTGVNRIDADLSPAAQIAGDGSGTVNGDVAVYDTGIDVKHPDLNVAGGVNCLGATDAYNDGTYSDGFGHGTHVARTFAAMNSTRDIQTVGGASYGEVLTVTAMGDSNGQPNVGSNQKFSCKSALNVNGNNTMSGVDDTVASFSDYATTAAEQSHTVAAPGVCIWSTYKNQSYGYMSGTSMAAPHAAGVVELCIVSGQCAGAPADTIQKVRAG